MSDCTALISYRAMRLAYVPVFLVLALGGGLWTGLSGGSAAGGLCAGLSGGSAAGGLWACGRWGVISSTVPLLLYMRGNHSF